MSCSSLLFIVITLALSPSSVQASGSLDGPESIPKLQTNAPVDSLSSEIILQRDSGNNAEEGSGRVVDDKISQALINHIRKKLERPGNENHSWIIPEFILPHSGKHDQGTDEANTSLTGHGHTTEILEEALYGSSHIKPEEHFKESHASTEYDEFQNGKCTHDSLKYMLIKLQL